MKRFTEVIQAVAFGQSRRFSRVMAAIKWGCGLGLVVSFSVCTANVVVAADEANGTVPIIQSRTAMDQRIDESSGLAASNVVADRFWTHNDSGDSARLFAIDGAEAKVQVLELQNVAAIDWEDMASGIVFGRKLLVVGDVGDNGRRRKSVFLHVIEEPREMPPNITCRTIKLTYPDGPGDCEAIGIDAENGRILLIKKTLLPFAGVYSIDLKFLNDLAVVPVSGEAPVSVEVQRIATLPIPMITGMDIRADGRQMVIVTYRDLFVYQRPEGTSWEETLQQVPKQAVLPKLRQIEAVCHDADGGIWVTSERSPMPLVQIDHSQFAPRANGANAVDNVNSANGKQ